jgi:hypothetical protein
MGGDDESIYDGAVYACEQLARRCFLGAPDTDDIDYEISWIELTKRRRCPIRSAPATSEASGPATRFPRLSAARSMGRVLRMRSETPSRSAGTAIRLYAAVDKAPQRPERRELFAQQGATPAPITPEEALQLIGAELARWEGVAREAGVTPQ